MRTLDGQWIDIEDLSGMTIFQVEEYFPPRDSLAGHWSHGERVTQGDCPPCSNLEGLVRGDGSVITPDEIVAGRLLLYPHGSTKTDEEDE